MVDSVHRKNYQLDTWNNKASVKAVNVTKQQKLISVFSTKHGGILGGPKWTLAGTT